MQMSLDAYRNNEKIDRPSFLAKPDVDLSRSAFLEQTAMSLILNGNAFWRVFRDNQGRVTGARVLNPLDVVVEVDSNGRITGYTEGKNTKPWTKAQVTHLSLMRVPGDPRGRGPIQAAQAELRGVLDVTQMSSTWFQEAGVPSGILSSDQPLNDVQAKLINTQWKDTQGGTRGTAILGSGYSYSRVYLSPEEAMWIEARQFDTTAIARLFGVPANLMLAAVEGSSLTYSNVSQSWAEFSKFTLAKYVVEIEEAFSALLPRGTEVKLNMDALLRPDVVSRYQMHSQALQAGFLSLDEVREIENLPPLPDGQGKFKTAAEKAQAFEDAQAAPGPGDTTKDAAPVDEGAPNE
jgi:HK97 family phage portal protein